MYSVIVAFGIASAILGLGIILRSKLTFLQNKLIPASVTGGILGFIIVNLVLVKTDICGVTVNQFSNIVEVFFTMSFISIGLTSSGKRKKESGTSSVVRGAAGMCLIWCILFAIQPLAGVLITTALSRIFDFNPVYGILVPFGFCQGPGTASTYGILFENTYGFAHSEMIALTYASIAFLAAFSVGIPVARYGLKKGLAKNNGSLDEYVKRGYYTENESCESLGKDTFHCGNIDSLAATFSIIGVAYVGAIVLAEVTSHIPVFGSTFKGMLFMWGLLSANIIKAVMHKLDMNFLLDDQLLKHITGFFSDYLVVCTFMSIQINIIGKWIIPILIVSIVVTAATFFITAYFSARLGSDHDFERMLSVYGISTGTVPSGISLLRIVDPSFKTPVIEEIGIMNTIMILNTPTMIFITLTGLKIVSLPVACAGMFASIFIYLLLLKILKVWQKPSFSLGSVHKKCC